MNIYLWAKKVRTKKHASILLIGCITFNLVSRVWVSLNSFGYQQRHLGCGSIANGVDKNSPRVFLLLAPAVGPAQHDSVGFEAAQPSRLNSVKKNTLTSIYHINSSRGKKVHMTNLNGKLEIRADL